MQVSPTSSRPLPWAATPAPPAARALFGSDEVEIGPAWTRPADAAFAPVRAGDGPLVVAARDGSVTALSPEDGTPLWTSEADQFRTPVAVEPDGTVVGMVGQHRLVALDGAEGREVWRADHKGYVSAPGVAADGTVAALLKEGGDQVVWYDGATGKPLGTRHLPRSIVTRDPVTLPDGSVLVYDSNTMVLHSLHYDPRRSGWRVPVGDLLAGDPKVADGTVFVPRAFGDVVATDPSSHRVLWKVRVGKSPSVTVGGGRVFAATADGKVTALDARSGEVAWERQVAEGALSEPALDSSGRVVVAGPDGVARGLDPATGAPCWSAHLGGTAERSLTGPGDEVFFADPAGRVVCLRPEGERAARVAASVETPEAVLLEERKVTIGGVDLPRNP